MNDSLKDKLIHLWDSQAPRYVSRPGYVLSPGLRAVWKDVLTQAAGNRMHQKVLDVGTGPGFLASLFDELGHDCAGLDFSLEMIKIAHSEAAKSGMRSAFLLADAGALPFRDESFDVVTNRHVVWTLTDPSKAMCEWTRVIKPGGRMIIFEGDWVSGGASFWDKVKKWFGAVIFFLQNSRPKPRPSTYAASIIQELPLRAVTQEKVAALMKEAGLVDLAFPDIHDLIHQEINERPFAYRLTYNKCRYLVVGQKAC